MAIPSTSPGTPRATWQIVALLVLAGVAVRAALALAVPLLGDEAYYWEWSRRLAPGYFDHPPGIAWLIAAGTAVLGATPEGIRLGPAVAGLVTTVGVIALGRRVAEPTDAGPTAQRAALLTLVLPVATLGMVLATPDAPLLACVVLSLLAVDRAVEVEEGSRSALWWILCGIALGAACVAKYMAVLVGGGIAAAVVTHPRLRRQLRRPGPYLAALSSLVVFSPVVLWNAIEDWVSFRFQLGHGFGGGGRGSVLTRELELVGGQLAIATPVLAVLLAAAVWSVWTTVRRATADATRLETRRYLLASTALLPALFFVASALRKPVEANWLALCYVPAIALLASHTATWARARAWRFGIVSAGVVLAVAILALLIPGSPAYRNAQLAEMRGWPSVAAATARALRDPFLSTSVDRWVAANRYQDAAQLAYHLPDHPTVFSLNLASRPNQYDLWQRPTAMNATPPHLRPGDGLVALFEVGSKGDSLARVVATWFTDARPGGELTLTGRADGRGRRQLWLYRTYKGRPGEGAP